MNPLISHRKFEGVFYRESKRRRHNGRPDRSFHICYYHQGRKHWCSIGWTSLGITVEDAYQARLSILRRIKLGQPPIAAAPPDLTVNQAMTNYLAWLQTEGKHHGSVTSAHRRWISPHCGNLSLRLLDHKTLDALKAKLTLHVSPATVHHTFQDLRAAVNHCLKRKLWAGINPISKTSGFACPPPGDKCERFLNQDEARRLLTELARRSPHWHDMALVSLHTGLRLTELFSLRGQDLDELNCLAVVTAKGGQREPVPLTAEALTALLRHRQSPERLLFLRPNGMRYRTANKSRFASAVKACGLNDGITSNAHKVWFHTLRHTFASWLAQNGVSIYDIMKLMRHKTFNMTQRYAHLSPEHTRGHLEIIRETLRA